jgi:hypothetical protein
MRLLSNATPGSARGIDPVAMITSRAPIVVAAGPSTLMRHSSPSLRQMCHGRGRTAILFF